MRALCLLIALSALPSTSFSAFALGGPGYYGGSSGGIPGTGVPDYRFKAALEARCTYDWYFFRRHKFTCERARAKGILPEDRQFPVWNPPDTLMR